MSYSESYELKAIRQGIAFSCLLHFVLEWRVDFLEEKHYSGGVMTRTKRRAWNSEAGSIHVIDSRVRGRLAQVCIPAPMECASA